LTSKQVTVMGNAETMGHNMTLATQKHGGPSNSNGVVGLSQ